MAREALEAARSGPRRPWPAARPTPATAKRVGQRLTWTLSSLDRLEANPDAGGNVPLKGGLRRCRGRIGTTPGPSATYGVDVDELPVEASID